MGCYGQIREQSEIDRVSSRLLFDSLLCNFPDRRLNFVCRGTSDRDLTFPENVAFSACAIRRVSLRRAKTLYAKTLCDRA
jgi:hypothetical protein